MLSTHNVEVFGLAIPYSDRLTVAEREALELLAVKAATETIADSRQKYEAIRIFASERLGKDLPAWRSKLFIEQIERYFDEYPVIEDAAKELLTPFSKELDLKKTKRQAAALAASGNVKALSAIIQAAEMTLQPFRSALKSLEKAGNVQN